MTRLILIDSRVPDVESILATLTPDTHSLVFDSFVDTFDTIQSRISEPYESVAIAQHKYNMPTFQFIASMTHATLIQLAEYDPDLTSWSEFIAFLVWLKNNGAHTVDLLACDLWSDENWKYAILKMKESLGLSIRASIDITGIDGNFVLESDNVDMVGIYFTPEISQYKYNFFNLTYPYLTGSSYNYTPPTFPSSQSATLGVISYKPALGYIDQGGGWTTGTISLTSDVSGVASVHMASVSVAVLKTDGSVVTYGTGTYSIPPVDQTGGANANAVKSELYNITKIVTSVSSFHALRSDGKLITWGTMGSGTHYTYIYYSDISNSLVGITDVVATDRLVFALTNAGKVIVYGDCKYGFSGTSLADITTYLSSDVVRMKRSAASHVVFFKSDGSVYNTSDMASTYTKYNLYNSNPVVDVCLVDARAAHSVYIRTFGKTKQLTNPNGQYLYYTMPEGVNVVKYSEVMIPSNSYVQLLLLSNNVLLVIHPNNSTTIITNVSEFENSILAYAYIQNGTVYAQGYSYYGGSLTDANYGLPIVNGVRVALTNVRRLVSDSSTIGAITFDGRFIWWGRVRGIGSATFPTQYPTLYNAMLSNVVAAYGSYEGYILTKTDGTFVNFKSTSGDNNTTITGTKAPGKNVYFLGNELVFTGINVNPVETSSLSQTNQFRKTTASYYNNNQDKMAIKGRKYALYNGSDLLSAWYCAENSFTFLFENAVLRQSGFQTFSVYDAPDFTTSKSLIGSFTATITEDPTVGVPDAPTINSVVVNANTFTVDFTAPVWNGGTEIIGYKYSINRGASYTTVSSAAPIVLTNMTEPTYTFWIHTVSLAGDSYYEQRVVTMYTVPSAPTVLSSEIGNQQVTLTMNTSANGGNAISKFKYKLTNQSTYTEAVPTPLAGNTSKFTIPNLLNGSTYSIDLRATNNAGDSTTFTYGPISLGKVVPFAPVITSVVSGDTMANIIFTPPYNGGDAITGYKYSIYNSVSNSAFVSIGLVDGSFSLTGLVNGTSYTVKMIATNSLGDSLESAVSSAFIPRTLPGAPSIVSVVPGNQSATVVFSAPASTGGLPITKYLYRLNDGSAVLLPTLDASFVLTGLTNGTAYTLTMAARTLAGESVSSAPSNPAIPSTTPEMPVIASVVYRDQGASVFFTANNGGSALTELGYSLNDASYVSLAPVSSPVVLSGLTNGETYRVKLRTVNANGASPESASSPEFVPITIPDAPVITSVVPGNASLIVEFVDGSYNGSSVVTGYKYSVNDGIYHSVGLVQSPYIIREGIVNGASYSVKIKSTNRAGDSPESSVSDAVIPFTNPDAPIIGAITYGDKTASLGLTNGNNGGYPFVSYTYSVNSGEPVVITSLSTLAFPDLAIGTTYQFQIKSTTSMGESAYSTTQFIGKSVPDAPSITSIVARNNSATVYFDKPSANESAITEYTYSTNGGTTRVPVVLVDASSFLVSGLTANTEYTVAMYANNAIGASPLSNSLSVVPYTYPVAPTIDAIVVDNGSASITYTAQNSNSSPITGFTYSLNNGTYRAVPEPFLITDLSNGVAYTLRMKAVNAAGASQTASSGQFMPRTVPESPTILSVTAGNRQCEVEFRAGFFNGSQITQYKYSFNGTDFEPATGTVSPITISGLTNGTTYMIYLLAVNEVGESNVSAPSSAFVPFVTQSTPSPPTITSAVPGDGSVEITFDAGENTGSAIKGYRFSIDNGVSSKWAQQTESPLLITGLTNGIPHTFVLYAVNNSGLSEPSVASAVVVPSTVPTKPYIIGVRPGNQEIAVSFVPSEFNGSVAGGYMYSVNGGDYFSFADQTATIYGLTNGTSYVVRMKAVNAIGMSAPSNLSTASIPFSTPDAPIINQTESMDQRIRVHFTPGDANGSTTSYYEYSLVKNGTSTPFATAPSNVSPFEIAGLTNGVSYGVILRAVSTLNARSASSEQSDLVVPCGVPAKPVITMVSPGNSSLSVYYVSSNNGAGITSVLYSLNSGVFMELSGNVSPFVIPDLVNGATYDITMKTVNEAGSSAESELYANATPFSTAESPTILSATPGDSTIQLAITPGNTNGSNVLGYKYSLNSLPYKWADGAESPLTIAGLTNGASYVVKLRAFSESAGLSPESNASASVIPYRSLDPPIIQTVTVVDGSATVVFANGDTNGLAISGYKYSIDGQTYTDISANTVDGKLQIVIPGLVNGTTYTVRIQATTATPNGNSLPSVASASFVPFANPDKPIIEKIVTGNQTASIYIIDGSLNGSGNVSTYQYSYDGFATFHWASSGISPIVITSGLVNAQAYRIQVKTKTEKGTSVASNQSSPFVPYTLPGAPTITGAVAGNGIVDISYTDGSNNGRPISKYQYSLNGGAYVDVAVGSPIRLSGLTNGVSYAVSLKSVNLAGSSPASLLSSVFVPFSVPSAPTITNVVAAAGQVSVYVAPGNTNGGAITQYQYSLNGSDYVPTGNANTTFAITGLSNGTTYAITVKADNAAGSSVASTTYANVVPYTIPDAPTISSVSVGNGTAIVYITNGANNGRTITQYQYTYTTGSTSNTLTTVSSVSQLSSFAITGLTNWATYTVNVKAINLAGASVASAESVSFQPFNIPGAPVISSVVPGNASLTVNMDGLTIGAGVSGYRYSFDGTTYIYISGGGSAFTITENIINAQPYSVRVKSVTSLGDSPVSVPYPAVIPYTVPNYPNIASVIPGNKTVAIHVVDGSNNGDEIVGYEYSSDGTNYTIVEKTSPIVLSNLDNWSPYSFYVKSVNKAGRSQPSPPSTAVVPFLVPTSATISAVSYGDRQLIVDMSGYTLDSGIIGYKYSLDGNAYAYVASPSERFAIPNLKNGQTYTFYAKSVTTAGDSPASSLSAPEYPRAPPAPPSNVVVTPLNESASIAFVDGSDNGAPIERYSYSINGEIDVPIKSRDDGTLRIFGLTNATLNTLRLRAVNNAGPSAYSVVSNTFVPYGVPRTPTIHKIMPGNNCAYVHFNPVDTNGSALTAFKYSLGGSLFDVSGITSPLTIPGLVNKTTYTVSIVACNGGGNSNNSAGVPITVGVPDAPVITSVVEGNKRLLVYFDVPGDNGTPISGYMFGLQGSSTLTKALYLSSTSVSPIQIVNLKNGTAYNPYICAVNKNGNSIPSNMLGNKVPRDVPSKVAITSVSPQMNSATVYFPYPVDNGAPVLKYKYAINADTAFIDVSGISLPIRIYDIPINTTFTVKIIATNVAGDSIVSVPSKPAIYVYLPPAMVKITALTMPTKNSLSVAFLPPALNGSPIIKYQYALNSDTVFTDASGTTLPLIITEGIVPNVSYNVRIVSVNSAGTSVASAAAAKPVSFVYLPPLAPTVTSIVPGDKSARVSLTAPALRGAPITGYAYSYDAAGLVFTDISGAVSPFTITGLTNDTLYNMRIAAITPAGYSPLSVAKPVTPVFKEPGVPVVSTIVAGDGQLTVNFAVPADNGSPITEYKYVIGGGVKISAVLAPGGKSFIITKNVVNNVDVPLVNGTIYQVQMCATNSIGDSALTVAKPGTPKA